MKKLLLILLSAMLMLSACGEKEETKTEEKKKETIQQEKEVVSEEFGNVKIEVDEPIVTENTVLGDYTGEFLSKYVEGGKYYIVQNSIIDGNTTQVEIAVDGVKASEKIGTQIKIIDKDMLYFVIHDNKAIITSPVADSMKEGFTNFISVKTSAEAQAALQNTGEEELFGEKFGFEEFKNKDGIVAKYYYDDITLRYVKMTDENGKEEIIQVVKISTDIPEEMFKIPDGYVIQDLSKIQ